MDDAVLLIKCSDAGWVEGDPSQASLVFFMR